MTNTPSNIDLSNRLALSIPEAAQVLGVSENTFRAALPEIDRVYFGRRIVIPVKSLRDWLESKATSEADTDSDTVSEILEAVR